MHCFIAIGGLIPLYSISLFLPTIIKDLGYRNNVAQLMSAPPYVVACFMTITVSYVADKTKMRGPFILLFQLVSMGGFLLLVIAERPHTRYGGIFVTASGMYQPTNLFLG